ncbi:MAG: primosomal protein N' [Ruminococcus sp.]|nr:primosomal protein N' [Ruminococcus sp.]
MSLIAEVAVNGTHYSFDMLFSYIVPETLSGTVACGCRVLVPFGRGNKRCTGVVMKLSEGCKLKLKHIISLIDRKPVLSDEFIKLAFYLHDFTFCTYFEAVKVMIPPSMHVTVRENFSIEKSFDRSTIKDTETAGFFREIQKIPSAELTDYINDFILKNGRKVVDELLEMGAVISDNIFRQAVGNASVKMLRLTDKYLDNTSDFRLTAKQKNVVDFLTENGSVSLKEAEYMCGVTRIVTSNLEKSGVAEIYEEETFRRVEDFSEGFSDINDIILSDEQQKAYVEISAQVHANKPAVFLLHGVTGSGKTSVFEKLISDTVADGRQVLMLIPEISLTPQILKRFRSLFGERVAVIHSGLTLGQRLDEYKRIKNGSADIVIGTRSAVFAPLVNIGLIIMDEEGESSYKSDRPPRYNTHDVAKKRCAYHNSVLVLASATPSVESYYLAEKGVYRLIEMKKRYRNMPLPDVDIIDMGRERYDGNASEFSRKLAVEINYNLENNEQTILLLNRRGYHTVMRCTDCGETVYCPKCSIPLTYHRKNGKMMCHFCGYSSDKIKICPSCRSENLKKTGFGTQKLEDEILTYFPTARILRMDADTTFSRHSYEKNFTAFRNGEYDIMIGTQMIGKGLDFPNVTLVGVLSVDKALYAGDFRRYEQTFSLITQVVGRSGRGGKRGRAILQTYNPDHYIINLASEQDYEGFYEQEIALRRVMIFPPVCDICVFAFSGADDTAVQKGAEAVLEIMREDLRKLNPKTPVRVIMPVKCLHGKVNNRYRWRIIMKCKNTAEIREFIGGVVKKSAKLREMSGISLYADMNGDTGL